MKKIMFLATAAMLWGCGGAEGEMLDTQDQLAQQADALTSTDAIIGSWAWDGDTNWKVKVDAFGNDGVLTIPNSCWNGAVYWRYLTYSQRLADGSTQYSGQAGGGTGTCGALAYYASRFTVSSDKRNLKVVYSGGYSETYTNCSCF
jgi:hypothetical protein